MVTSVRPIPESYYYSGQGRLSLGDRDPVTGKFSNILFVGNVTTLSLDIATTKFTHKESMSGQRATDLTIIQEKTATFKFTSESLDLNTLSVGLYGGSLHQPLAAAVTEVHTAKPGYVIGLGNQNVTAVTTFTTTGGTPVAMVENTDYTIDLGFGTIYVALGSTVVTGAGTDVTITYSHGAYDTLEAFTQSTVPEKYLRFEGLNTINGDLRLLEIPRAQFDPLTGLEFINADIGSGAFSGSIILDPTITDATKSQFFRERRVTAV